MPLSLLDKHACMFTTMQHELSYNRLAITGGMHHNSLTVDHMHMVLKLMSIPYVLTEYSYITS